MFGKFKRMKWNKLEHGVFSLLHLGVYKRGNWKERYIASQKKERKDIYIYIYILLLYHLPFTCYFFPFKIEIRLIFHIHFNKGMSVPLTFGRNA